MRNWRSFNCQGNEASRLIIGQRKEMEGSTNFCQGFFRSDSYDSVTPDQSPLTPLPLLPGFLPFLGFSTLASSYQPGQVMHLAYTREAGQMHPLLFYGMCSSGGKIQLPSESLDQPPVYVNARQFHRILKRRMTRKTQNLHARNGRSKSYIHESRHQHACNRARGPSGVFLPRTKPEDANLQMDSLQLSK